MIELRALVGAAMLLCIAVPPLSAQGIEGKVAACAACHGDNGLPKIPEAPILWGQQAGNLYIELRDFKSGARKSDIMQPQVANLEDADMVAIAKYFAAKPWPHTRYQASDADRTAGERINQSGMCTQCHLGGFVGDGTIPRIGGQTETYLRKTMLDFKTNARANNPAMSSLLASYSDAHLAAMARYLAGLSVD